MVWISYENLPFEILIFLQCFLPWFPAHQQIGTKYIQTLHNTIPTLLYTIPHHTVLCTVPNLTVLCTIPNPTVLCTVPNLTVLFTIPNPTALCTVPNLTVLCTIPNPTVLYTVLYILYTFIYCAI